MWFRSGSLVVALATAFFLATGSAARAADLSCTPPGADLSDLTRADFSSAQVAKMESSYTAPEVRGLRAALDAYLAGDAGSYATHLLTGMSRSTLRSQYILLSDEDGAYGGSFLIIRFKGHPDHVYEAWVYPLSAGPYELRAWIAAKCSAAQSAWIKARYGWLEPMMGE